MAFATGVTLCVRLRDTRWLPVQQPQHHSLHRGATLEKGGKQAVTLCHPPFAVTSRVVSFADPDLTPDNFSPHHDYPSSDESVAGACWCASVSVADVTFVATPVEREILVDDPADFDHIDPFLV